MAASGIDWTDAKFREAIETSFKATAKIRGAFKAIGENRGAVTVMVPSVKDKTPLAYGVDKVESALQISVRVDVDEQRHGGDLPALINLISWGAAELGALEDRAIVELVPVVWGVKPGTTDPQEIVGVTRRQPNIPYGSLRRKEDVVATKLSRRPTGLQIVEAVATAIAMLENADRPGIYSLILQNRLLSILNLPVSPGASPQINAVSTLLGGHHVVGTSALKDAKNSNEVCGILFRYDPPAVDLVQTQSRQVILLGRSEGNTNLRIEESIAVRVLDEKAVHYLEY